MISRGIFLEFIRIRQLKLQINLENKLKNYNLPETYTYRKLLVYHNSGKINFTISGKIPRYKSLGLRKKFSGNVYK